MEKHTRLAVAVAFFFVALPPSLSAQSAYEERLSDIDQAGWTVSRQVDFRLNLTEANSTFSELAIAELDGARDRLAARVETMPRQEFERDISFEVYERARNEGLPKLPVFPDQAAQIETEARQELEIRELLEERDILTGPSRLDEDGFSYIWEPSPSLGYFGLSIARDPRPIIVHEGTPGHYLQLVLSWAHENPIRRHYYDSGANEGIGFYAEEMMLQAGLFEDSPRSREIIYNFARLRVLRVEVDVKLATGEFSITSGAGHHLPGRQDPDPAHALRGAAYAG